MSALAVNFNKLDNLIDDLNDLESDYNARIGTVSSSYSSVSSIYNEFGYLSSAGAQLSGKVDALEANRDRIIAFKNTLSEFRTFANDEESGLAERIFVDSDTFMDEMGITPEYEKSGWDKFCETVCDVVTIVVDAVVDAAIAIGTFVIENWDQILVVVGEILIAAAAIAAFILTFPVSGVMGALTMVAAGWAAFKAVTELMGDAASLGYSAAGDEERAKEAAEYDARELFNDVGEGLNNATGWDHWDEVTDGLYIGLDTVELIVDIKDIVDPGKTDEVLEFVDNLGNTLTDIPDKGVFAFNNFGDAGHSDDYEIFSTAYDYFDSTSAIVTDAMAENGVISTDTQSNFDNAVDFGAFIKDMYDDNKTMSNSLGANGFSTFDRFLMVEGNTHETLSYLMDISE